LVMCHLVQVVPLDVQVIGLGW